MWALTCTHKCTSLNSELHHALCVCISANTLLHQSLSLQALIRMKSLVSPQTAADKTCVEFVEKHCGPTLLIIDSNL